MFLIHLLVTKESIVPSTIIKHIKLNLGCYYRWEITILRSMPNKKHTWNWKLHCRETQEIKGFSTFLEAVLETNNNFFPNPAFYLKLNGIWCLACLFSVASGLSATKRTLFLTPSSQHLLRDGSCMYPEARALQHHGLILPRTALKSLMQNHMLHFEDVLWAFITAMSCCCRWDKFPLLVRICQREPGTCCKLVQCPGFDF